MFVAAAAAKYCYLLCGRPKPMPGQRLPSRRQSRHRTGYLFNVRLQVWVCLPGRTARQTRRSRLRCFCSFVETAVGAAVRVAAAPHSWAASNGRGLHQNKEECNSKKPVDYVDGTHVKRCSNLEAAGTASLQPSPQRRLMFVFKQFGASWAAWASTPLMPQPPPLTPYQPPTIVSILASAILRKRLCLMHVLKSDMPEWVVGWYRDFFPGL